MSDSPDPTTSAAADPATENGDSAQAAPTLLEDTVANDNTAVGPQSSEKLMKKGSVTGDEVGEGIGGSEGVTGSSEAVGAAGGGEDLNGEGGNEGNNNDQGSNGPNSNDNNDETAQGDSTAAGANPIINVTGSGEIANESDLTLLQQQNDLLNLSTGSKSPRTPVNIPPGATEVRDHQGNLIDPRDLQSIFEDHKNNPKPISKQRPDGTWVEVSPTTEGKSLENLQKEESWRIFLSDPSLAEKHRLKDVHDYAPFELSEMADSFILHDLLGDKLLTEPQVESAMYSIGMHQSTDDFRWAVNKVDPEGKGVFSYQMFIDIIYLFRRPPLTDVELQETFELMDRDKSGTIDSSELRQVMTCLGHGLTQEEAENMIEQADRDMSGEIDYPEFAHAILSTQ